MIDIFKDFAFETYKFANALKSLGVKKGDVLFSLSPRIPELYTVALGALRLGVVFSPLFSAFGPEPVQASKFMVLAVSLVCSLGVELTSMRWGIELTF